MKMDLTKKLAVLLVGMPIASASVLAAELSSFTNEVKVNDYDNGYQITEWTLGKGAYKLNDDLSFIFDVDKNFVDNADGTKEQGWDTQFGIVQAVDQQVAGFDIDLNYLVRYDAAWNAGDGSDDWYVAQYIFSPWLSKDITIAGKDFSLGIELWAQVGEKDGASLQDYNGYETSFYLDGDLSDNWVLNLAWYNFDYYDGDKYAYQIGTEDYLTYTLPLKSGFSFAVESYVEAYYTPDNYDKWVSAHIQPMVKYNQKVNDDFSWHASIAYNAVEYTNSESVDSSWGNNEMEILLGFTI
ncbi:MAG: hypothetical protein ACJAZP_000887 [Psychromonas sp.]|jgi:hypothetical protein|uniref:hypothetical protein n=1 Tax=Psychromonas sp. TaxID=1884585 RepID=UPI0039E29D74